VRLWPLVSGGTAVESGQSSEEYRAVRALAALLMIGLSAMPLAAIAQGRPQMVQVDPVVQEPLTQTSPVIGRFVARQRGVVAALTRGPVSKVLVEVGDRVKKGDVLVELDSSRIDANLRLERAALSEKEAAATTAQGQLALAEQELRRLERLKKSAAFSQARYDDKLKDVNIAISEVAEAQAAAARAQSNVRLAEIDLGYATIRAPYNGVVAERHTEAGAYVSIGNSVVTLVNDEDMEVEADVPSDRISGLEPGRLVSVRLMDGSSREAVVRAVVPEENAMTRTRPVRLVPALNGADTAIATNQSVTVLVPVGEPRTVLSVAKDGIVPQGGRNVAFIVKDGKAEPRTVRLGEGVGDRFEVLEGLQLGDLVVVRGNERLRPGQPVTYQGMKPPPGNGKEPGGKGPGEVQGRSAPQG